MKITLNGETREVAHDTSVAELVAALDTEPESAAVACNGEVVPRSTWDDTSVCTGDVVEIVSAAPGG